MLFLRMEILSKIFFKKIKYCFGIIVLFGVFKGVSTTTPHMNILPKPSFAEPIPNVTVSAGRDVSLPCVIENLGNYRVAWSHKDKNALISIQTRVIMKNPRYKVTHQNFKIWYLHLSKVEASDSGNYMCQINTTPMISQTGHVNVVVAPSLLDNETSSDIDVREGNDVSLQCSAYGSPKPSIKWRREDEGEIPIGNEKVHDTSGMHLNLTKVSRLIMGAYLCIASNGIPPSISKRIMLNVLFPPMIWIPNQLVGIAKGSEVSLDCHLESYPEPVTYWTKGPNHIVVLSGENQDSIVMRSGMYKIQMRLRIRSVSAEDYGAYTCVAKNSLGETEGKIRLYETEPTTTSIPKPQEFPESDANEFQTIPSVSLNNWNSDGINTAWQSPEKGSIMQGVRNRTSYFEQSTILQITLFAILYGFSWIMERRTL